MTININLKIAAMDEIRTNALKQHFTDAEDISTTMCQLLGSVDKLVVLEPSVGHGAFIAGLCGTPKILDAVDIDPSVLEVVRNKFAKENIVLHHCDFIDIFVNDLFAKIHRITKTQYDAVISNPPYGLHLEVEYRRKLKKIYPHLYVRESFGLFFIFAVSQLKAKGRYVFLIPDTFLMSKNHTPLRRFICSHAAPEYIMRFPSKRFETVNFGYGNLCIIAGEQRALRPDDVVKWQDCFDQNSVISIAEFSRAHMVEGAKLLKDVECGWSSTKLTGSSGPINAWPTLGELAECRTGIYTGDNRRFIGYDPARVSRRLNGHPVEWRKVVQAKGLSPDEKEHGFAEVELHYVPLVRGGHHECFHQTAWAIDWSKIAIQFYKTDKKARFQNSKYYFSEGLSVPMVTTRRISAALMKGAVFDQGVVGVFPRNRRLLAPLLLYLNSSFASSHMKGLVNGSANNSANYLKRLPVPPFSESQINEASEIVQTGFVRRDLPSAICNSFVESVLAGATKQGKTSNRSAGFSSNDKNLAKGLRSS